MKYDSKSQEAIFNEICDTKNETKANNHGKIIKMIITPYLMHYDAQIPIDITIEDSNILNKKNYHCYILIR